MPNKLLLPVIVTIADELRRAGYPVPASVDSRITAAAKNEQYYETALMQAVEDRYNDKTTDLIFLLVFSTLMDDYTRRAYMEGLQDSGYTGDMTGDMEQELTQIQQQEDSHVRELLAVILILISTGAGIDSIRWRVELWAHRYSDTANRARIAGAKRTGRRLQWQVGPTEHCGDCKGYNGQVKSAWEWDEIYMMTGHRPQAPALACHGYRCQCRLVVQ